MHKEKSIEDILASIYNLVSEAKRENEMISNQGNQQIISPKLETNEDFQDINETSIKVLKELQKKKMHGMKNWENIDFDKNESLINVNAKNNQKERISNDIKQIFEERVKVWLKNNLKKSFEKEFRNHTNQILEKKLK